MLDLNVLFAETKDIREYYREAIRSVYGVYLDEDALHLDDFDGPIGDVLKLIMKSQSIDWADIDAKLELFIDELSYAYYNVAGHDAIIMRDGANQMLSEMLSKGMIVGICTNTPQGIAKVMFDRAKISFDSFKFTSFGGPKKSSADVLSNGQSLAMQVGAEHGKIVLVSASQDMLLAGSNLNMSTIGVSFGKKKLESNMSLEGCRSVYKYVEKSIR